MLDYTFQNHLTFGYRDGLLNQKTEETPVQYYPTACTRQPGTFEQECTATAHLVLDQAQAAGRPVYALVSGGLDSVAMVKGFKATGRPFKTATYVLGGGASAHELVHVHELVEVERLDHSYLPIDQGWLIGSEAHEWFHHTRACEIGTLPLMKLMYHVWHELGGFPVFGGGDIDVIKCDGSWFYSRFESFLSRYWFSRLFGIDTFVSFFQHTPEITLSMLNEPEVLRAGSGQDDLANRALNELKIVKYRVIHRTWPGLKRRPKYGGTELIHGRILPVEQAWNAERPFRCDGTWTMPFMEYRQLLSPSTDAAADGPAPR